MPANVAKQAEVAERRAKVVSMKARGARYPDIARELGISEATARKDASLAYQERAQDLRDEIEIVIAEQVEELESLRALAWREAITKHPHVTQSGRVALNIDGSPIYDSGPNSRARRDLLAIQERKAKLLGLDAALKVSVKADINLMDAFDQRIAELNQMIAAKESRGRGD
jgi:Homeodomain-like domain